MMPDVWANLNSAYEDGGFLDWLLPQLPSTAGTHSMQDLIQTGCDELPFVILSVLLNSNTIY